MKRVFCFRSFNLKESSCRPTYARVANWFCIIVHEDWRAERGFRLFLVSFHIFTGEFRGRLSRNMFLQIHSELVSGKALAQEFKSFECQRFLQPFSFNHFLSSAAIFLT